MLLVSPVLMAGPGPSLEVVDHIGGKNSLITMTDLDALPQKSIETHSPYFEGSLLFTGPNLAEVLRTFSREDVGSKTPLTLRAMNDYVVRTSLGVLAQSGAIIATRKEGSRLSIRERGPFWIMLPLSERPELDEESYHRLLVWQLQRIDIGQ